ncbi:spermidine/putrescine ABC transporter substrate-binding protein PotF [Bermanella sp. 47_1433_sub80_T6]|nr:spermidine/putrescine ABC transporter substrate-binding protein PotF [Bermanella sp. 47_1433_sub80_T6]
MTKLLKFKKLAAIMAIGLMSVGVQAQEELRFFNWSDYMAEDTIEKFEAETGIKVIADVFDSNEVLEAKLLAGRSGYDLVVPSSTFMARQIIAGAFQPLDKSQLPNMKHLDKELLTFLQKNDPGNRYGVPYLWGTTGIGYNVEQVKKALGTDAPLDSWDLVFKPENMKKLAECGVIFLDSADEIFPLALNYVGQDPNSTKKGDYKTSGDAAKMLSGIRPYINQFHSSQYINSLANGDACVAIGWSGDVLQAQDRASEAENGVEIEYIIPKEGTSIWFDMLVVPADAKNVENAHKFINFLLRPDIIADISNYVYYANPNTGATEIQDQELSNNPGIYPSSEVKKRLFAATVRARKIEKVLTRSWTNLKTGR